MKKIFNYFSVFERVLWSVSVLTIVISFFVFGEKDYFKLAASLIGATALVFNAKGNPIGQVLMIIFGVMYGIISYSFKYYGEMITYLGMSVPMAAFALVSWLKNPYNGNKAEVKVNKLKPVEYVFMFALTALVTFGFYFILDYFNTANIIPSTLSVATSFAAVYLTFRRSPFYAVAYALNDIVLIVLWVLATISDISYLSVVICFVVFLANDLYGFASWNKMSGRQNEGK